MVEIINRFTHSIRMADTLYGKMLYNHNCIYLGRALEVYGEYNENENSVYRQVIKPEDVVWEIGSNAGEQTVLLSQLANKGKVISFEPQNEIFKILSGNLCINNCNNVYPHNFALGAENTTMKMPFVNYDVPGNYGGVSLLTNTNEFLDVQVEVRTADSLYWLPKPNFMKIDVEGMELEVLKGAKAIIRQNQPLMYIENDRPEKSEALIQYLWDLDYKCFWHLTLLFNENNFLKNRVNIYGNISNLNMFCIPNSQEWDLKGMEEVKDKHYHPYGNNNA